MGRIFTDDFNRVAGTLGGGWDERNGGSFPLITNMSTDGSDAILDAGGFAVARAVGTSRVDQYVQCWLQRPDVDNNCGIAFRIQNDDNFYYAIISESAPSSVVQVWRAQLGVAPPNHVTLLGQQVRSIGTGTWHRIAVTMVGSIIKVFWEGEYMAGGEGPVMTITDATYSGPGPCGICTSGNNGVGLAGGLRWSDFVAYDGQPETIYVDVNGTRGVDALGTESSPDIGIDWALNAAGLQRGGRIKLLNDSTTPIGNGVFSQYRIGHAGKFSADGNEEWPRYSPLDGTLIDAGRPNLIIEGNDAGPRTLLREGRNDEFFEVRNDATYILIRGLDWEMSDPGGGVSSSLVRTVPTNNLGASTEHSVGIDKCIVATGHATIPDTHAIRIETDAASVRFRYNLFTVRNQYANRWVRLGTVGGDVIEDVIGEFNVFTGPARRAILCTEGPPIGSLWRFNHNTYVDLNIAALTVSCLEIEDGTRVLGVIEHTNSICVSRGANPVTFGTRLVMGVVAGTIEARYNGYQGILTPRDVGVTDGGEELDARDPQFEDELVTYTWPQSAQSPSIVVPSDWRPTDAGYVDTADDNWLGVALDRGALQTIIIPPSPVPPGPRRLFRGGRLLPDFCASLIYDPDGRALDLSDRILKLRPLRQQKELLLRSYRLADTHVELVDREGLFVEGNENNIITLPNGEPDWFNKECLVQIYDGQGSLIIEYRGFLIGKAATRGKTRLRLANRFQQMFVTDFIANSSGVITSTTNDKGLTGDPPSAGSYLAAIRPHADAACGIEEWTFTFTNALDFACSGSITGADGTGNINETFRSDSGKVTAYVSNWTGAFVAEDKCSIRTVYRYAAATTMAAFVETITGALAGRVDPSMLDESIDLFTGSTIDRPISTRGLVIDSAIKVLEAMEMLSRHMLGIAIEKADGKIGIYAYLPTIVTDLDILCKHSDLMAGALDNQKVYNRFTYSWDYDEVDGSYNEGLVWPTTQAGNPSADQFGLIDAPKIELRGFDATQRNWVRLVAQQNYERWRIPRPIFEASLKADRLAMEINELFRVDSEAPTTTLFVEPATIIRNITPEPKIEGTFVDASFYVQFEGQCGWAFHDAGHWHDGCWLHF